MTENAETNRDARTVDSFGSEWSHFDQSQLVGDEHLRMFGKYFDIFPWDTLPDTAEGFDMGCGSGRWAKLVAPRVGKLNCIDASDDALAVARANLAEHDNITFTHASVDHAPLAPDSQDFGYSLGVLHHIPDTAAAMRSCVKLLKPGAPFLVYLYYRFDNRPLWFRGLWKASELLRGGISRLPDRIKPVITDLLAGLIYWPLARFARVIEMMGINPAFLPLSYYRLESFYTMRTDSRDRFGTPLEQRFTRAEITEMMQQSGLKNIRFSENEPYWVALGNRAS